MSKSLKNKLKNKKILLGPLDSGLNFDLKTCLEKQGFRVTTLNFVESCFGFPSDIVLRINRIPYLQAVYRVLMNFFHSFGYDLFLFRFGQSLLPWNLDLPIWRLANKKIIMNFDGNDIRISRRFNKTKYNVIFSRNDRETAWSRLRKILRYYWIKLWADKITVATPDLLEFAPAAELVFNIVPIRIKSKLKFPESKKITVLHAPTNRGLKGTQYIIKAVKKLQKEKYPLELIVFENQPHHNIDRYYHRADIVIDQLLMGALSTVSLEGMLYAKPVICYVRDDLRRYYPKELPVISANSDTIYEVLKDLISHRSKLSRRGQQGFKYIKKYHYPAVVAKRWQKIYEDMQ